MIIAGKDSKVVKNMTIALARSAGMGKWLMSTSRATVSVVGATFISFVQRTVAMVIIMPVPRKRASNTRKEVMTPVGIVKGGGGGGWWWLFFFLPLSCRCLCWTLLLHFLHFFLLLSQSYIERKIGIAVLRYCGVTVECISVCWFVLAVLVCLFVYLFE